MVCLAPRRGDDHEGDGRMCAAGQGTVDEFIALERRMRALEVELARFGEHLRGLGEALSRPPVRVVFQNVPGGFATRLAISGFPVDYNDWPDRDELVKKLKEYYDIEFNLSQAIDRLSDDDRLRLGVQ